MMMVGAAVGPTPIAATGQRALRFSFSDPSHAHFFKKGGPTAPTYVYSTKGGYEPQPPKEGGYEPEPEVDTNPTPTPRTGYEGDEGNEGYEGAVYTHFQHHDGDEGYEGDEGDEGKEGDEGDEGHEHNEGNEGGYDGDEGDEGHEGHEDDEGDEGDEGHVGKDAYYVKKDSTTNYAVCQSKSSAGAFAAMHDAHIGVTAYAIEAYCDPHWDGSIENVYHYAEAEGAAIAKAVAAGQADCVSKGNAFGCTSATATAEAWAEATAEAHSLAVAKAFDKCHCDVEASSLSIAQASTFIEMSADVFSRAEVFACSEGDSSSWAVAYSQCTAVSYAKVWTKAYAEAYLSTGCATSAAKTKVIAATGADFITIEGCERFDKAEGHAYGSTEGSHAEAFAEEFFPSVKY